MPVQPPRRQDSDLFGKQFGIADHYRNAAAGSTRTQSENLWSRSQGAGGEAAAHAYVEDLMRSALESGNARLESACRIAVNGVMKPRHPIVLLLVASNAFALTGQQYLSQAKVPPARARKLALKAYSGKIISEELERERGGSGLRYSFVIRHNDAKHEVGIDAKTGKVLENSIEGEHPD